MQDVGTILAKVQESLLARATEFRDTNTHRVDSMEEFVEFFSDDGKGGFALCHWAGSNEDEEKIAKDHKVTIRCIPDGDEFAEEGECFLTGAPSSKRVVFAKAY